MILLTAFVIIEEQKRNYFKGILNTTNQMGFDAYMALLQHVTLNYQDNILSVALTATKNLRSTNEKYVSESLIQQIFSDFGCFYDNLVLNDPMILAYKLRAYKLPINISQAPSSKREQHFNFRIYFYPQMSKKFKKKKD